MKCRAGLLALAWALVGSVPLASAQGLPYPSYTPYQIKGIGVEFRDDWNRPGIIGNMAGNVVINIPWFFWESSHHTVCTGTEISYGGYCYQPDPNVDSMILNYSNAGVMVGVILVGTPWWAALPCTGSIYCATDPAYSPAFGLFAAMVSNRYNGLNGHGRVVNFVIHNEVNAKGYYDNGCGEGGGPACTVANRVAPYVSDFNAAYDGIKSEQAAAKVLISLNDQFAIADDPNNYLSGETFLTTLASQVGSRAWQVALHPYDTTWYSPAFSVDDWPLGTPGTLGRVVGWLRETFPSTPSAWEIHLTEGGLQGDGTPTGGTAQADWLCNAYRNVLGTPGVEVYDYTPMSTHVGYPPTVNEELAYCTLDGGGNCVQSTVQFRWAWATWALANRIDVGQTSCGFEQLPYTKFSRYYNTQRGHWATTRLAPSGSNLEGSWRLLRSAAAGTHLLYECLSPSGSAYPIGGNSFVTPDQSCDGLAPMGPLGYIYDSAVSGTVALYRCYVSAPGYEDHFVGTDCGGWTTETLLGYALPSS